MDDDAKIDASRPERDGLNPAGPADAAAAPVAGDDVDVASLRRSRGEPGKHEGSWGHPRLGSSSFRLFMIVTTNVAQAVSELQLWP